MTIPTTIRHDGEDLTVTDLYDPTGLAKGIVTKAFPEGTEVAYKPHSYGRWERGTLTSHTPHIYEVEGHFSAAERKVTIRPANTKGPRAYYRKAETWANSSVGFLVTGADGVQHVTKHILGLPATVERIERRNRRAAAEGRKREDLNRFAKAVRKGATEHALKAHLGDIDLGHHDLIEADRYGSLSVPLAAVEALLDALAPGDLDHAKALILDAIEAGTLPEEVEE